MTSYTWIQKPEFLNGFICMNSDVWSRDIFHDHEFRFEFILWMQVRFHDHGFICYISWPMNSDMNSCIWKILWIHIWNQGYQGSRCKLLYKSIPTVVSHMYYIIVLSHSAKFTAIFKFWTVTWQPLTDLWFHGRYNITEQGMFEIISDIIPPDLSDGTIIIVSW